MRRIVMLAVGLFAAPLAAAELVLPQNRLAFYFADEIEVAVAGLKRGEKTTLDFVPSAKEPKPLSFKLTGDGSTLLAVLAGGTLAPGEYTLKLGGKGDRKITVSSNVRTSPMLLSGTVSKPKTAG